MHRNTCDQRFGSGLIMTGSEPARKKNGSEKLDPTLRKKTRPDKKSIIFYITFSITCHKKCLIYSYFIIYSFGKYILITCSITAEFKKRWFRHNGIRSIVKKQIRIY